MNTLYSILAFTLVLGIIVLVHEFGHYMAARLMGVRVLTFSFGFGKRLFGKKIGDTDFRVSIIPLGGFVKMAGEDDFENKDPKPDEFHSKNRAQKIFILFMGSAMNFFLAFFILTIINITGVRIQKYRLDPPEIGYVEENSPAKKAGIQKGDLILTIDGRKISNWEELELIIGSNPDEELEVEYERNGKKLRTPLKVEVRTRLKYDLGYVGFYYDQKPEIGLISAYARKAGLKNRDVIVSVDDFKISNYFEMKDIISRSLGKDLHVVVNRNDELVNVKITPKKVEEMVVIGVYPNIQVIDVKYGFFEAMEKSTTKLVQFAFLIFDAVKKMVVGKLSPKNISGPLEIADISKDALKSGLPNFFFLIAIISLNLGIINLFPIPVLDGGHLMIYSIEAVIRKEFNPRVKSILMNIGFFILILLMVFIILNDIAKKLPDGWNSFIPF